MIWIGIVLGTLIAAVLVNSITFVLAVQSRILALAGGVGVVLAARIYLQGFVPPGDPDLSRVSWWAGLGALAGGAFGVWSGFLGSRAGIVLPDLRKDPSTWPAPALPDRATPAVPAPGRGLIETVRRKAGAKRVYDEAMGRLQQFLREAGLKDWNGVSPALNARALDATAVAAAERGFLEALGEWRELEEWLNCATASVQLAALSYLRGDAANALQRAEECLDFVNRLPRQTKGALINVSGAKHLQGLAVIATGDLGRARTLLGESIEAASAAGDREQGRLAERALTLLVERNRVE